MKKIFASIFFVLIYFNLSAVNLNKLYLDKRISETLLELEDNGYKWFVSEEYDEESEVPISRNEYTIYMWDEKYLELPLHSIKFITNEDNKIIEQQYNFSNEVDLSDFLMKCSFIDIKGRLIEKESYAGVLDMIYEIEEEKVKIEIHSFNGSGNSITYSSLSL